MGAGFNYVKAYKDYGAGKYSDADFERYVDSKGDLSGAWNLINTYRQKGDMSKFPMHGSMTPELQAEYWINRGATSKAAFGRSHAAEDAALYGGTYSGGRSGRTDLMPGTQAWKDYFGDAKGTRFEQFSNEGSLGGDGSGTGPTEDTGPKEGTGTDWSPLMDFEYTPPTVTDPKNYMPGKNTGIWGDTNLRGLLYNPGTRGYDKAFKTSQYMDWSPAEVESGVPGFGSRFLTFDLPDDEYWSSLLDEDKDKDEDDDDQRGGRTQAEIDEQKAQGFFVDKYGNKVKRGYKSWADFLAGISIADRQKAANAAAGLAGSGNVGASVGPSAGHPGTPAGSGKGVSHSSADPDAL